MRFRLLGPVEIAGDGGRRVPIPSPRVRTLAAILLLEGSRPTRTESIVDLLWDDPPPSASANLRNHVTALRRILHKAGQDHSEQLVTLRGSASGRSSSYLLATRPEDLDVTTFQRLTADAGLQMTRDRPDRAAELLETALGLWRGLAGEDVSGSRALTARLDALNEQQMIVREHSIAARMACGENVAVIHELRDILAAHPLRERSWGFLVRALYLSGDVSSALTAYRQAEATIRDELGIGPPPELRELHLAILRRDDALAAPVTRTADHASPPPRRPF